VINTKVAPNNLFYLLESFHIFWRPLFISLFCVYLWKRVKGKPEILFFLTGRTRKTRPLHRSPIYPLLTLAHWAVACSLTSRCPAPRVRAIHPQMRRRALPAPTAAAKLGPGTSRQHRPTRRPLVTSIDRSTHAVCSALRHSSVGPASILWPS
jgi:hypothetical protein